MIFIEIYVIQPGDTIYKISKKFNIPMQTIINDNSIVNANNLAIGQTLVLETNNLIYTIKRGDSLYSIAKKFNITLNQLIDANPTITNPDVIYIDQTINIPPNESTKLQTIDVNGYAFPGTSSEVLNNTLPYLTYLSIFSYETTKNGDLEETIYETNVINSAIQNNVKPIMVVTNTKKGEGFDSDLAHAILTNKNAQNKLINNILATIKAKKYYGVNIDFEYVYQYDKDYYNQFLQNLTNQLHPMGYIVTTALAPKISSSQQGILYEAHDYKTQGEIVDQIILMTYEWGYTYGPAQAVAPINQVEKVLQYATSVIPSKKILMGMPNYGYNWTLPFVKGSAAQPLTNLQAIKLAIDVGATIQYDTLVQAPFFEYTDKNNKEHIVWFDDARSIEARLKLVYKYNLKGVSYWNINTFFKQNWLVLSSIYNINKLA